MRRPARPLLVAAAATALYAAYLALARPPSVLGTNLLQTAVPALAAVACAGAARAARGSHRTGWALAAAACASWAIGQACWTWLEWRGQEVPFPSAADAGYLPAVPLLAGALLLLGPRTGRATRLRILLDGLLTATAMLFVMWVVVLGPMYRQANQGPFALAVALAYPLGDIVMAAIVLNVAARAPREDRAVWLGLALGVAGWALADSGFAYLATTGAYGTGDWIDSGWLGGFLLVAAAGRIAALRPLADTDTATDALRLTSLGVPWVATGLAIVAAITVQVTVGVLEPFLVWTGLAFVALILLRQMASQVEIRRLNERLLAANRELAGMLAERQRGEQAHAELEAARRQAQFRTEFLNSAAHELATPMTPILMEVGVLERMLKAGAGAGAGPDAREEERRHLAILHRNFDRLRHLVQDLLLAARMDLGRMALRLETTDLRRLAEQAVEDLAAHATDRGVQVEVDPPAPQPVLAAVDPRRIAEVLSNLLTNAVKFTPPGGHVAVAVAEEGGRPVMRVTDTGIGLTPEQRARLFQPFVEIHAHGPTVQSTGLGLYIAKGLVERHGGDLSCESPGTGLGSRFTVRLPAGLAVSPPSGSAAA